MLPFLFYMGLATEFPHQNSYACRARMPQSAFMAGLTEGCAHRTLPCGTRLLLINARTRRSTTCTVVDRGPYGAIHNGVWVLKRRVSDPGKWRGILDILPEVSKKLAFNGKEPLLLIEVKQRDRLKLRLSNIRGLVEQWSQGPEMMRQCATELAHLTQPIGGTQNARLFCR